MEESVETKRIREGKRIEAARKQNGFTQTELANHVHCTQNYISLLEQGKRGLNRDMIKLIAKACKVRETYLTCESEFMTDQDEWENELANRDSMIERIDYERILRTQYLEFVAHTIGLEMEIDNSSASSYRFKAEDGNTVSFDHSEMHRLLNDVQYYAVCQLKREIDYKKYVQGFPDVDFEMEGADNAQEVEQSR